MTQYDLSNPLNFVPDPPHALWDQMRSSKGLTWQDRVGAPGFYSVTQYSQLKIMLRDSITYSSEWGMTLDSALGERDPAAGLMIELTDPPRHMRLRKLVTAALTPQFVSSLAPVIAEHSQKLVSSAVKSGEVDAVTALAGPMPRLTIGSILGIPKEDHVYVVGLASQAITGADGPVIASEDLLTRRKLSETANNDLLMYFVDLIETPERLDPAGLIQRLITIELEGAKLSADEVLLNCLNLVIGGYETTKNVLASAFFKLTEDPDSWNWLRQDSGRVEMFLEEVLRFYTPAMHLMRTVTKPTQLGETELAVGDSICGWISAANRDPAIFENPHKFQRDRGLSPHLAFTIGPHFCLGSVLARLELRTLLTELVHQASSITARGELIRRPSNFISGIESFPILLISATN